MFAQWLREAQAAGWRLSKVQGVTAHLQCSCLGCAGSLIVPISNPGPKPDPCDLPHRKGCSAKVFSSYEALVAELRRRRVALGLSQIAMGEAMGVAEGHINKLEAFAKVASPPTLLLWAETLGLTLTTAETTLPKATARAIERSASAPYQPNQARFKHG